MYHCVFRNAKASPWTRHAQLLLPVSWRSRADHTTAGMVSHRRTKRRACTVDSCKEGAITVPSPHVRCTVTLSELRAGWRDGGLQQQQQQQLTQGRSASGCSCCTLRLQPQRSSVCPAHVKHITSYVPLHNHMAA